MSEGVSSCLIFTPAFLKESLLATVSHHVRKPNCCAFDAFGVAFREERNLSIKKNIYSDKALLILSFCDWNGYSSTNPSDYVFVCGMTMISVSLIPCSGY